MKPITHLIIPLLAGLGLLFSMASAQAQEIRFDCQTETIGSTEPSISVDYCKPDNIAAPVKELTRFATSVYELLGTGSLPEMLESSCTFNPDTYSYDCSLASGSEMADQPPINFNCVVNTLIDIGNKSPGDSYSDPSNYNGSALCTLASPNPNLDLSSALTLDCKNDSVTGNGVCTFSLNREPILDAMQEAANFDEFSPNERAIHDAFWTCLNRVGINPEIQAQCDRILLSLAENPDAATEIVQMLKSVTPNNIDISMDVSSFNVLNTLNNIVSRLTQLRHGYASNSVRIQYFDGQQWLDRNTLLASNNLSTSDVSPEPTRNMSEYGRLGLFLNASTIISEQDAGLLEQSHDASTQIATLGVDYRFTDNLVAGLAVNLSQGKADYGRNAGKLDSNSTALVIYSSYYVGSWYLDASLNLGQDNYEQERNVHCNPSIVCPGGFYQSFTSDFNGSQNMLSVATGYQWQKDAWGITPFIQLNSARIKTNGYDEAPSSTGIGSGAQFAISLDDQTRDSSTVKLGANVQYTFATSNGVIIPLIGLYGVREIEDNANIVTGRFVGNIASNASFNLATNDMDTSYFIAAAGLNFQLRDGNAGFINIQSTESYENLDQVQVTAGWRWEI